ncbi:MAG: NADH ubiquinone oxidoreductase chain A, partial [uncultured Nocardioidaceae bacterium]
ERVHPDSRHRSPCGRLRDLLGHDQHLHGSEALQPCPAGLLRVRDRADTAADRWWPLPGQVLHHSDALHRLRHRDHLPVPLRGRLRQPRLVRPDRDGPVHRHRGHRLCLCVAAGRSGMGL